MSKLAEIRARANYDATNLIEVDQIKFAQVEQDRRDLLDIVARMRECLNEFAICTPILDDERLRYVEIQVGREDLELARALLEEA